MDQKQSQQNAKDMASWKPGSEPEAAKDIGASRDFGAPAEKTAERDYVSANTKRADPGAAQPFAWEHDGVRDHGALAPDSGPGSASGGDLDPDIVGVGTSGGLAQNGPDESSGPDDANPTSNAAVSQTSVRGDGKTATADRFSEADVMNAGPDVSTTQPDQGADAATNPDARDDDSFAGEISSGEARGDDNP